MENQLLITKQADKIITAWAEDGRIRQFQAEPLEEKGILGNIYVGKVRNIVKNINAVFVEFRKGEMGYLSLQSSFCPIHTDSVKHEKNRVLIGDEIIVQVEKEAVKTKPPTLTGSLEFSGKYVVLTAGEEKVSISRKIKDKKIREKLQHFLQDCCHGKGYGLLARTNSAAASEEDLRQETERLEKQFVKLVEDGKHRAQFCCLYQAPPAYLEALKDIYTNRIAEVLTDDEEIFRSVSECIRENGWSDFLPVSLWNPERGKMDAVYDISKTMEKALQQKVWLKNGAYLIIQYTEALVVVDVNTGKAIGKKDAQKNFLKVNLEAAKEIAVQLRLRNLSGIILIDFIDMTSKEAEEELLDVFRAELAKDPVPVKLVDMTKLGLVELTRKKVRKPLHEQLREIATVKRNGD